MAPANHRQFKQEFRDFIEQSIKKYKPSDADLGIMFTNMQISLATDMNTWFYNEKEEE